MSNLPSCGCDWTLQDTVFLNVGFESLVIGEVELCKLDSIRLAICLGRA